MRGAQSGPKRDYLRPLVKRVQVYYLARRLPLAPSERPTNDDYGHVKSPTASKRNKKVRQGPDGSFVAAF